MIIIAIVTAVVLMLMTLRVTAARRSFRKKLVPWDIYRERVIQSTGSSTHTRALQNRDTVQLLPGGIFEYGDMISSQKKLPSYKEWKQAKKDYAILKKDVAKAEKTYEEEKIYTRKALDDELNILRKELSRIHKEAIATCQAVHDAEQANDLIDRTKTHLDTITAMDAASVKLEEDKAHLEVAKIQLELDNTKLKEYEAVSKTTIAGLKYQLNQSKVSKDRPFEIGSKIILKKNADGKERIVTGYTNTHIEYTRDGNPDSWYANKFVLVKTDHSHLVGQQLTHAGAEVGGKDGQVEPGSKPYGSLLSNDYIVKSVDGDWAKLSLSNWCAHIPTSTFAPVSKSPFKVGDEIRGKVDAILKEPLALKRVITKVDDRLYYDTYMPDGRIIKGTGVVEDLELFSFKVGDLIRAKTTEEFRYPRHYKRVVHTVETSQVRYYTFDPDGKQISSSGGWNYPKNLEIAPPPAPFKVGDILTNENTKGDCLVTKVESNKVHYTREGIETHDWDNRLSLKDFSYLVGWRLTEVLEDKKPPLGSGSPIGVKPFLGNDISDYTVTKVKDQWACLTGYLQHTWAHIPSSIFVNPNLNPNLNPKVIKRIKTIDTMHPRPEGATGAQWHISAVHDYSLVEDHGDWLAVKFRNSVGWVIADEVELEKV